MWIILDPNGVAFWMVLGLHRAVQVARKLDSFTMLAEGMSRSWPNLQARIWPAGKLAAKDAAQFDWIRPSTYE